MCSDSNCFGVLIGEQNDTSEITYLNNPKSQLPVSVQDRIKIMQEDPAAGNVLSAMDVVVSAPSGATESFGLSAAEALWIGKPVVASTFGLAALHPQYFYGVALDETPQNLASAITQAYLLGCRSGAQAFVKSTYTNANFIGSWTTLLKKVTGRSTSVTMPAPTPALAQVTHAPAPPCGSCGGRVGSVDEPKSCLVSS